jgi:hypothetical protein
VLTVIMDMEGYYNGTPTPCKCDCPVTRLIP